MMKMENEAEAKKNITLNNKKVSSLFDRISSMISKSTSRTKLEKLKKIKQRCLDRFREGENAYPKVFEQPKYTSEKQQNYDLKFLKKQNEKINTMNNDEKLIYKEIASFQYSEPILSPSPDLEDLRKRKSNDF